MAAQQQATHKTRISNITILVSDEDRALSWYRDALGCEVRTDQTFDMNGQASRWLTVGFPGQDLEMALMRPMPSPGRDRVDPPGNGTMTVIAVDDCDSAVGRVRKAGGKVEMEPSDAPWGRSAIVRDPDGNPFNLMTPVPSS